MPFLTAAVRAYGAAVLAGAPDAEAVTAAGVGRRLLGEVFGAQAAGGQLPEPLAAVLASLGLKLVVRPILASDYVRTLCG